MLSSKMPTVKFKAPILNQCQVKAIGPAFQTLNITTAAHDVLNKSKTDERNGTAQEYFSATKNETIKENSGNMTAMLKAVEMNVEENEPA